MPCRISFALLSNTLQQSLAVTPHEVNKEYTKPKKGERQKETEEERAIRKEKERKEKGSSKHETEEERAIRKKKERDNHHKLPKKHPETDEERRIRKDAKTKLQNQAEELRSNKKPSKKSDEKKNSELDLKYEYTDQLICASDENCVKPNDYVVDWLDCSSCEQWFHNKCVSVDPEMAKNKEFEFYCKSCEFKRSNISKKHQEYKKPRRSRNAKKEADSKINDCFKTTERSESPEKHVTTKALNISDKISNSLVTKSDKDSTNTSKKPIEVVTPIKKHKSNRKSETTNQADIEPSTVGTHSSISQLLQSLSEDKSKPQAKALRNQEIKTSIETTRNQSNNLSIEPPTLEAAREPEMESVNETSSEWSTESSIIDVESIFIDNITYTEIPSEYKASSPTEPQIATPTKQSTEHKMECPTMSKYVPTSESINESEFVMESLSESLIEPVTETSGTSFDSNEDIQAGLSSNLESDFVMESLGESQIESVIETSGTSVDSNEDIDKIFSEMLMPPPILPIFTPKGEDTNQFLDQQVGFETSKDFMNVSDDSESLPEPATQLSAMPTSQSQTELIRKSAIKSLTNSIVESLKASIRECLKESLTESIIDSVIETLTETEAEPSMEPTNESQSLKKSKHPTELVNEHKPTTKTEMENTFDKEVIVKNESSNKKSNEPIKSQFLIKKVVKNVPSRDAPCLESLVYEPISSLKPLDQRGITKEKEAKINKTKEISKNLSDSLFAFGPKWEFEDKDFNLKSLPSELMRKNLSISQYLKRKKEKTVSDKPLTIGPEWGHEDEELTLAETFDKIKELKWGPKMESKAYEALRLGHADQTNQMKMIPASSLKTLEQRGIEKEIERKAIAIEEEKERQAREIEIEAKRLETEEIRKTLKIPLRSGQAKQSSFVNAAQKRLRNSKIAEASQSSFSENLQERPPKRRKIEDNKVENFKPHELLLSLL